MSHDEDQQPRPATRVITHTGVEPRQRSRPWIPFAIGAGALAVLAIGAAMVARAESKTNKVALADEAKPVTVVLASATTYRPSRQYVGTLEPWVSANIGPQLVSAYIDTVLVRPGADVKKGDVIATLDCRNASATSQAVAMQARALEAKQKAVANESARITALLDGGYVSANEAEQKEAQSAAEQAQLLATQAKLLGTSLEVSDCVLRAPFSGEVATRSADPGAFVKPGNAIVSLVDRTTVRVSADAPEVDFEVVAPQTKVAIHILSTGKDLTASIARRAPAADPGTRTVHFEIDVPDPNREIPVGTTAELRIEVGAESPATMVPLTAAAVRGAKANLFVVDGDVARAKSIAIKGEVAGKLYLDPQLAGGSKVVTEGRALLNDGDHVVATLDKTPSAPASAASSAKPALKAAANPPGGSP